MIRRICPPEICEQTRQILDRLVLKTYGNPCLRTFAEVVKTFGENLEATCWAMLGIMDRGNGIGLGAQQVGLKERICIVDTSCQWDNQKLVELDGKDLLHSEEIVQPFPLFLINAEINCPIG
jgi:peptide deformylase